jgi:hypothetical protein
VPVLQIKAMGFDEVSQREIRSSSRTKEAGCRVKRTLYLLSDTDTIGEESRSMSVLSGFIVNYA